MLTEAIRNELQEHNIKCGPIINVTTITNQVYPAFQLGDDYLIVIGNNGISLLHCHDDIRSIFSILEASPDLADPTTNLINWIIATAVKEHLDQHSIPSRLVYHPTPTIKHSHPYTHIIIYRQNDEHQVITFGPTAAYISTNATNIITTEYIDPEFMSIIAAGKP